MEKAAPDRTPTQSFLSVYPYWLKIPFGWNYPAACSSGIAGKGGWSASVDQASGEFPLNALMR
jgi:hypothetical protein